MGYRLLIETLVEAVQSLDARPQISVYEAVERYFTGARGAG